MTRKRKPKFTAPIEKVDLETPEAWFRAGLVACAKSMKMCAPAIRAITPVFVEPIPGMSTFGIDKNFRVYACPDAVMRWVAEARAVSASNPCETCGAKEHHPVAYVGGVIGHEIWHPLREHLDRVKDLNLTEQTLPRWRAGSDCEINDDIIEVYQSCNQPRLCLPAGVCLPKRWNLPDGKLAEFYYYNLPAPPQGQQGQGQQGQNGQGQQGQNGQGQQGQGQGQGQQGQGQGPSQSGHNNNDHLSGGCGSACDGQKRPWEQGDPGPGKPGISEAEGRLIRKKVAKDIQKASQSRGTVPAGMLRWADEVLEPPKYDWRKEMRKAIPWAINRATGDEERSYRRLSRRCSAIGYQAIMASTFKPKPVVKIVFDTSGSMGGGGPGSAIAIGMAEVQGIVRAVGAETHLIGGDAAPQKTQKITSARGVTLEGGGGTDMTVLIDKAMEEYPSPNVIIVITDGFTPWPKQKLPNRTRLVACLVGTHCCEVNEVPDFITVIKVVGDDIVARQVA